MARANGQRQRRRDSWLAALAAASLLLTALSPAAQGGAAAAESPATTSGMGWGRGAAGQRSADARFIVMMIPHHQGAIAMAELAPGRARRPEIRALAQRIIRSQSSEIAQMRQWYRQWYGTEVPAWQSSAGMGMGMGMGWSMPGMGASLEALKTAPEFDRAFIEQMIPHHRMGVMMASHAEWSSQHPELRELEAAMVRVQSQEIEQMAQWYSMWFGGSGR